MATTIVVAGATGNLGGSIVQALLKHEVSVTALVRAGTAGDKLAKLDHPNVRIAQVDMSDVSDLSQAFAGASCVVSALQGVSDVIVNGQFILLDAALTAGVPRFIPSDFCLDFTKFPTGENRNLDFRRAFHEHLDSAPISATSILNGAFSELLTSVPAILDLDAKRVTYWGNADQLMDFTTIADTATFTAAAALDPSAPKILRIAGDQISARQLAAVASEMTHSPVELVRLGSLEELTALIQRERAAADPESEQETFPQWQGNQYLHNMFSGQGKLEPLDNDRYGPIKWTSARDMILPEAESPTAAVIPGTPEPDTPVVGMVGFTHRYADVNDTRLHYVIGGSGPAIVLLHGWPYTWAEWRKLMPPLAEAGYTVIAPDLRGLGDSAKPASGYAKSNVAEDVRQLTRRLGFEETNLVGTDIGMMVAYAYTAAHPGEVRRLVLGESLLPGFGLEELMNPATGGYWHFGFQMQVDVAEMLTAGKEAAYLKPNWKMMSLVSGTDEATNAEYLRNYAAPGGMRGGFQHYATLLEDGKENRAGFRAKLTMPVLVLNGDKGIPQSQTLAGVEKVAADVKAEIIPGCGHAIAEDNPEWVGDRLIRFFGSEGEVGH